MRYCTQKNSWTTALLTTPVQILGPNFRRKSIVLSPIAGGTGSGSVLVAVVFAPGAGQRWIVPAGVTQVIDCFCWGAGGDPGAPGAVLGGGGGGGGGFSTSGPLTVVPGSQWVIDVDAHGAAGQSDVSTATVPLAVVANSGADGVLDVAGAGASAGVGVLSLKGGSGATATALGGTGGGGGGAGGYSANGANAALGVGGAGGGVATYLGYGAGGTGGNGGLTTAVGLVGGSPGAGGGGSGNNGAAAPGGANGQVVIFYAASALSQGISVSQDPGVVLGLGSLNYLPGATYPLVISDNDLGDVIGEPWYAVSGLAGAKVMVQEYMYEVEPDDLGEWVKKLAGW
jgi:hypothetical protein